LLYLKSVQCQRNCNPYAWHYIQWSHNSQFVVTFMDSVWHWKWVVWHLNKWSYTSVLSFYVHTAVDSLETWKFSLKLTTTQQDGWPKIKSNCKIVPQLPSTLTNSTKWSSRFMIGSGCNTCEQITRDCADNSCHR
jgi:hypothetical protein